MRLKIWAASLALAAGTPGGAPAVAEDAGATTSPTVRHLAKCPDNIADFIDSDATAKLVRKCLGKPAFENQRADGSFSWVYPSRDGRITMAFAFNPDGSLMRARAYAQD